MASPSQGLTHPLDAGYGYYAGAMYNLGSGVPNGGYYNWEKNVNGVMHAETRYATTDTAREAGNRAAAMQSPWFLYVAFNAPHTPLDDPPPRLCPAGICSQTFCPHDGTQPGQTKALMEALDTEIGKLLADVYAVDPNAYVFLLGDNGTARDATEPPFDPEHAKPTLYQGGVNVPFIVSGPGVRQGECAALISTVDLLATLTDLAGSPRTAADSVSFLPHLWDANAPPTRTTVYAKKFLPNYDPSLQPFRPDKHTRAIRNDRYKLIRFTVSAGTANELYDLLNDPFEQNNLLPPSTPEEQQHFNDLLEELVAMGVACAADTNTDGDVDIADLWTLLSHFGRTAALPSEDDADRDTDVDLTDLAILLGEFGRGC